LLLPARPPDPSSPSPSSRAPSSPTPSSATPSSATPSRPTPSSPKPSTDCLPHDPYDGDPLPAYWAFYRAVAAYQLAHWLPCPPARVLDLSGPRSWCAHQATAAGHTVIKVVDPRSPPASSTDGAQVHRAAHQVIADTRTLAFLADGCLDAVIAEDRMLSRHLATESTIADIARALRPGGRLLLSVDSLVLGLAILAEQDCWAQLSDVPRAEVVLVPWPDGTITRCFWADQLRELITDAGLEVEWIRPRTVLSPSTVEHVLSVDPTALPRLVRTELATPISEETVGVHLVADARKPR
jgi:SAM-dependent methyltransferase